MKTITREYHHQTIACIKKYIADNPGERFSLAELSKRFLISPYHLCRTFKEISGIPLNKYILAKRLDKALQQVTYTPNTLHEIAADTGFNNYESLSRAFKKQFNISPDDFRNILRYIRKLMPVTEN